MAGFRQRFSTGLRFIFTGKSTVAALQPSWQSMQPSYATAGNFEILVQEGYRKNELIYACINATASSASQIALQLKEKKTDKIIEEHPMLDLIHRPNDYMNETDFWASIVFYQKLAGRAIYEIEFNNRGEPAALWPLRPDKIQIVQSEKRPTIEYYVYKITGLPDQTLKPEQMLDFPLFDPLDRFKTYPPVAVAGRTGDVDNAATDHIKMTWESGGMPMGILKTTQSLTDVAITDTRRRWRERYGGHDKWREPAVLDRDQEYQKISWSFEELRFDILDARDEARICMCLDVPPIIIGAKIGLDQGHYAMYEQSNKAWWENDLIPMYESFMDVINYRLLPHYDPEGKYEAIWDISKIKAFQPNVDNDWKRATEALRSGGITLNEYYTEIGLATIGAPGEVRYLPLSTMVVPAKQPAALPVVGGQTMGGNGASESKVASNAPDDDERRKHERKIQAAMQEYWDGQLKRVKKDAASLAR